MKINLIMYRDENRTNFGDELSVFITECMLNKKHELQLNKKNTTNNFCAIGSMILACMKYNNVTIWGTGIRTQNDKLKRHKLSKICAVRGPKTAAYLKKYGYKVPNIYGDPALLLPKFYEPVIISDYKDKIGIVAHLTNVHKYNNLSSDMILINPTWQWQTVVNHIVSCKLILSSSLHGLIVADAYNVPYKKDILNLSIILKVKIEKIKE